ncbi:MAG: OadG family protein [Anaerolineae bacterium]
MSPNVIQALELTGMGMALVILTLLIVAAIIMILGRVCGTSGTCEIEPEPATEDTMDILEPAPPIEHQNDEAAAIALAIALQRRQRPLGGLRRKVDYSDTDTEIIGEVVNVVNINSGSGSWANASRLQSTK